MDCTKTFLLAQDAIQAQMVIQKMSELGMSSDSTPTSPTSEQLQQLQQLDSIAELQQPLYANVEEAEEDDDNANSTQDSEINRIPVSVLFLS